MNGTPFLRGQRWSSGTKTIEIRGRGRDDRERVVVYVPNHDVTKATTPEDLKQFVEKHGLKLMPESVRPEQDTAFEDLWAALSHVPPEERGPIIVRAARAGCLTDDQLDHLIQARLPTFGGEPEEVYEALGLEPFSWPLAKANDR